MPLKLSTMIILAIVVAGTAIQCVAADGESVPTKRVLLLFSHQSTAPINFDWDRGFRRTLGTRIPDGVKIDIEHLDIERTGEKYRATLVELLRHKYADRQIDVVIPFYTQATEFVLEHRELFGDAAIVFCSVPISRSDQFSLAEAATGVACTLNFADTVEVARNLFPEARRLYVLSGFSKDQQALMRWAKVALRHLEGEIMIEYDSGTPLRDFLDKITSHDEQSLVLVLTYGDDVHGRNRTTVETVEILAEHSSTAVFGLYDTLLGHGIVGGKLASAERQGELAGQLTARVLNGEDASTIPVAKVDSNEYMFDARESIAARIAAALHRSHVVGPIRTVSHRHRDSDRTTDICDRRLGD